MNLPPASRSLRLIAMGLLLVGRWPATSAVPAPLTFTVAEHFGVAHPDQIITFDLPLGAPTNDVIVVNDAGEPVEYQFLAGGKKLAVRTELPAGASRVWKLQPASTRDPQPATLVAVAVTETATHYEITNDRIGVRIPKVAAELLAPVQGVRVVDGQWAATGPNLLTVRGALREYTVRFLERGPLQTVVEVAYAFDRPEYRYGATLIAPAGPGYYRSTITVQAGQPSILFEEDTDMDLSWSLDFYKVVQPTRARYRGHSARLATHGREPDGHVYRPAHDRGPVDAEVDLQYERDQLSRWYTSLTGKPGAWRWMALWDPWVFDSGWYWQLFNHEAPETAPLVGIFAGRASRLIGAHMSGPGIFTMADPNRAAGIAVSSYRRGADGRVSPRSRFQWGLFVSTKADLLDPTAVQPINRQMNLHGGFNLDKISRWTLDFPDPPGGYGGAFMPAAAVADVKRRVREDDEFYHWLSNADPGTRPLFEAWRDDTGAKRDAAVAIVRTEAHKLLDALVNDEGIYQYRYHYWIGGLTAQRYGIWIDQLLAEPGLTAEQRTALKAAAVLFANLVWDDDHAPISSDEHGLNLGTENMPLQHWGYRRFYALFLGRHPTMRDRVPLVVEGLRAAVEQQINDHGAHIGCPHYIGASILPTLNNLLQIKQLGARDPFADWPRLARFAEFFLNLTTPPEPRVGCRRCFIALGDSGVSPSEIHGVLGTGFRDANPVLSARLLGLWRAAGKPHSFFFGSTVFMIDDRLPAADPGLGDADFPGYYSVLRHGWGTPNETAVWVVNGEHYRDHRHQDRGASVIYALGAPVSVQWSAIYTPRTASAYLHSLVVPESVLGHPWDRNGVPLAAADNPWQRATCEHFGSSPQLAVVVSRMESAGLLWRRRIEVERSEPSRPLILIRDTFDGSRAAEPKIASFNLMATGTVQTPLGEVMPPSHTHPVAGPNPELPPAELPSATPPIELPAGLHRFGFTGRFDVDFDVYIWAEQPVQTLLGNWAVTAWGPHVTEPEERQHILRVRGTGPFTTLIMPRRRGEPADPVGVRTDGKRLTVQFGSRELEIGP